MNKPVEVIERLEGLRSQWWLMSTLCTFVWAVVGSLTLLASLILMNLIVPLPTMLLRAVFAIWIATSVGFLTAALVRAWWPQRSLEAAARRIELTFPRLENHLISLVQWSDAFDSPVGFHREAIREAAEHAAEVPMETAADCQTRTGRWKLRLQTPRDLIETASVLAVQLALLFLLSYIPQWSHSADRFWGSFTDAPQAAVSVGGFSQVTDTVKRHFEGENDD